jgi:SAM-dependent MidA family methyltransferase
MNPLQQTLVDRIRASGPMPFAAFMSLALYDPRYGYYAAARRTGWQGHFVTSAELDPAFGALWAHAFESVWDLCDRPREFEVIEVGPGEGGFAAAVLDAISGEFAAALTYRLIERMAGPRERQEARFAGDARVRWSRSITDVEPVDAGIVFANEVLDNLPVHLVERRDGELTEVCVDIDGAELVEVLLPLSNPELGIFFDRHDAVLPEGHRGEATLAAESFCTHAARSIGRGAIVFVDYGDLATDLVDHPRGTLVCYSATGPDDAPLERPGEKDITAHTNWSAVIHALQVAGMEVSGVHPQRDILRALGMGDLDTALKRDHDDALAAHKGVDVMKTLSRRHALRVLSDPSGLGALDVVVGYRGILPPPFLT